MKTYSHIRRQALNQAAAALEPTTATTPTPPEKPATAVARRAGTPNELCHSPRHNWPIVAAEYSDLLKNLARHLGRVSQLSCQDCMTFHGIAERHYPQTEAPWSRVSDTGKPSATGSAD